MDANSQLWGIRFSGESVYVNVYDRLTSLDQQEEQVESRSEIYSVEMDSILTMTLDQFLTGETCDDSKVARMRATTFDVEKDRLKSTGLKLTIPTAIFSSLDFRLPLDRRLITYNSLLCLSFSRRGNPDQIKQALSAFPFVYYAGINAEGTGVTAIIPIVSTDWRDHQRYFDELEWQLRQRDLIPDKAGRRITTPLFQTVDPDAYFNRDCVRFSLKCPEGE